MRQFKIMSVTAISIACLLVFGFSYKKNSQVTEQASNSEPITGCVFRTVMGEESSVGFAEQATPEQIHRSLQRGLSWIDNAQNSDGGWGAGSHARQDITDPHAVPSDPATTAMVSMALLRTGNTLQHGEQTASLQNGLRYLLQAVESSPENDATIGIQKGTQIQTKLGDNIDVILTAQFLSNILDYANYDIQLRDRIKKALDSCVRKIQRNQQNDGSIAGAGWAGVLQSALATSALESAEANGISVDTVALKKSRDYQKGNYNTKTGEVSTVTGAGVVLYSVTGSARASAKDARKVKEDIAQAKLAGKIPASAPVTVETLNEIGYSRDDAAQAVTTYQVYESAKIKAQDSNVMQGFGNNGGEEFLSYLQTGEGLVINKDESWKKWFDDISGRLLKIQNNDGSWNGHHCITSPVFCTATCMLVLSINNDIEKLTNVGKK